MTLAVVILMGLMGATLGLIGGGGTILAVPILTYVAGLDPKQAIVTSLVVVSVTSAVGVVLFARRGLVNLRLTAAFAPFAMAGAYFGGLAAKLVPGTLLLTGFALLMLLTGVAMLRNGRAAKSTRRDDDATPRVRASLLLIAFEGAVVGFVTGMVGAGGGFLIVPALVLFGGVGLRQAMGTSLLIIALKSATGALGYLSHVDLPIGFAVGMSAAAIVGILLGSVVSRRLDVSKLKRLFALFVSLGGVAMLVQQIDSGWYEIVFLERWPFWVGGTAIAVVVMLLLVFGKKMLGVSGGFEDACSAVVDPAARRSWRLPFLVGIVFGGLIAALVGSGFDPTTAMGRFDSAVTASLPLKGLLFLAGGVLIGFGTRLAGGCTSGHGILGTAQLAKSSWLSTAAFMASGFVVTQLVLRALGG